MNENLKVDQAKFIRIDSRLARIRQLLSMARVSMTDIQATRISKQSHGGTLKSVSEVASHSLKISEGSKRTAGKQTLQVKHSAPKLGTEQRSQQTHDKGMKNTYADLFSSRNSTLRGFTNTLEADTAPDAELVDLNRSKGNRPNEGSNEADQSVNNDNESQGDSDSEGKSVEGPGITNDIEIDVEKKPSLKKTSSDHSKEEGRRVSFDDALSKALEMVAEDQGPSVVVTHLNSEIQRRTESLDDNILHETERRKSIPSSEVLTPTMSLTTRLPSQSTGVMSGSKSPAFFEPGGRSGKHVVSAASVSTKMDAHEEDTPLEEIINYQKKREKSSSLQPKPSTDHTRTPFRGSVIESVQSLHGKHRPSAGPAAISSKALLQSVRSTEEGRPSDFSSVASSKISVGVESPESTVKDKSKRGILDETLRSIDRIVYKNGKPMIWKKLEYSSKEILVPVPPNSLISESDAMIRKMKRSYESRQQQQRPKRVPCDVLLKRKLGPGAYNVVMGGFSQKSVEGRASGPGWARQLEVERLAALPHLLYKEQWEQNKMLKRKLGPGSYEIKDFIQLGNEKHRSGRGICDNLAPRFEKTVQSATPGPGTYGIGGVPQRALEDKDTKSATTKGMLDAGDRKRNLPSVGSHLGPGTYNYKSCTDELLNKVTSVKGPYKLFSGDRNKPISEGYFAAPRHADLGPGQYEIGSFVDELGKPHRQSLGRFGKMAQYPDVPTDRIFLFSQAHYPKAKDSPGPGAYEMQEQTCSHSVNSPGFLSSAKRDDKISQKFFTRNFNPVGPGRYDIQKFEEAQDANGHNSVFKSKSGKPNLQMAKFLQERIRAKDVKVEDRVFLSNPTRMTRSITCM